jgi:hypothetical protein
LSDVPLARLPFLSLRGACGHHRWRLVPLHCSRRLGRWECNDYNALVWLAAGSALATLPCVMFRVLAFPFYRCIAYSVQRVHTHSHLTRDLIGTVLVATTLYREYAALQSKVFQNKQLRYRIGAGAHRAKKTETSAATEQCSYLAQDLLGTVLVVTMPCRGAAARQSEAFQNKQNRNICSSRTEGTE